MTDEITPELQEMGEHLAECWAVAKGIVKDRLAQMKAMKSVEITPELAGSIIETEEKIAVHLHIEGNRRGIWRKPVEEPEVGKEPDKSTVVLVEGKQTPSDKIQEQKQKNKEIANRIGSDVEFIMVEGKEWPTHITCRTCNKTLKFSKSKLQGATPIYYYCQECGKYTNPNDRYRGE